MRKTLQRPKRKRYDRVSNTIRAGVHIIKARYRRPKHAQYYRACAAGVVKRTKLSARPPTAWDDLDIAGRSETYRWGVA
jgi:hypothetical protein